LTGLTVRLLRRILPGLLTIWTLLAGIRRLGLAPSRRLTVRLLRLAVRSRLLLPVRIGWVLPVRLLLPVITHADKISAWLSIAP